MARRYREHTYYGIMAYSAKVGCWTLADGLTLRRAKRFLELLINGNPTTKYYIVKIMKRMDGTEELPLEEV